MFALHAREETAVSPCVALGADPMRNGSPLAGRVGSGQRTGAQTALRALLDRSPNTVVIPGTTSIQHLEENMQA